MPSCSCPHGCSGRAVRGSLSQGGGHPRATAAGGCHGGTSSVVSNVSATTTAVILAVVMGQNRMQLFKVGRPRGVQVAALSLMLQVWCVSAVLDESETSLTGPKGPSAQRQTLDVRTGMSRPLGETGNSRSTLGSNGSSENSHTRRNATLCELNGCYIDGTEQIQRRVWLVPQEDQPEVTSQSRNKGVGSCQNGSPRAKG